ncbi:hypothetical protein FOA43_000477 [Brettanomyces nanus]|uniref:Uncharacterized protein n=1 Tax=Eeniella nana TaxID=13502 RepID=A0A875RVV3_EENNA|nr:uncharacterized protein FOA43_000477 [Brettanomyces nanus]QPG73171.1 hypothetical protein FOA43_000477 [Brettanomyces nanus]
MYRGPNSLKLTKIIGTGIIMGLGKAQAMPITAQFISLAKQKENNSVIYRVLDYLISLDTQKLGKIFGWVSAFLYISSRVPQIFKNIQVQSTGGVSLKLIICALVGNLLYAVSLLTSEDAIKGGHTTIQFWEDELCYLVGSIGTVFFDAFVILQWIYYDIVGFCEEEPMHQDLSLLTHCPRSPLLMESPSKPIKFSPSVLSPKHIRKLSEFTPLTPIDFLLDDYGCSAENDSRSVASSLSPSADVAARLSDTITKVLSPVQDCYDHNHPNFPNKQVIDNLDTDDQNSTFDKS